MDAKQAATTITIAASTVAHDRLVSTFQAVRLMALGRDPSITKLWREMREDPDAEVPLDTFYYLEQGAFVRSDAAGCIATETAAAVREALRTSASPAEVGAAAAAGAVAGCVRAFERVVAMMNTTMTKLRDFAHRRPHAVTCPGLKPNETACIVEILVQFFEADEYSYAWTTLPTPSEIQPNDNFTPLMISGRHIFDLPAAAAISAAATIAACAAMPAADA